MTNLILLCIDLGTTTGWARLDGHGAILSGTARFAHSRFEGGGMRYLRFKRWLTEIKQSADGIDAVFFEEVRAHAGTPEGFEGCHLAMIEGYYLSRQPVLKQPAQKANANSRKENTIST